MPEFDMGLWVRGPARIPPCDALIGLWNPCLSRQTLAAKKRQRIDPDQDLVGFLGAANLAAAFSAATSDGRFCAYQPSILLRGAETPGGGCVHGNRV